MVEKRFPLRKYLRQIADMESDFRWWEAEYRELAEHAASGASWVRATDRVEILMHAREQLGIVYRRLEELPRLS